jgi:Protein of unknown function (DUF559)
MALGLNADAIQHRIDRGKLHPLRRGVYALGRPELTRWGVWMAAVLACGPGALLSHLTAALLWRLWEGNEGSIEVSVARDRCPQLSGVVVHRRVALRPEDITEHMGIPVTGPISTLIDIAPSLSRAELERAVNQADKLDLATPEEIRVGLDRAGSRRGVGVLRKLLDRATFTLTDSELERRFLPIATGAGLPLPLTQQIVNGFRVDFFWPDLGLIVETDGLRYHRTPAQQARDRLRDQTHTAAGLTPLRFTHAQVRYEPGYVRATLARAASRLRLSRR